MMQDEENRNRSEPASRARLASRTEASSLICRVQSLVEIADRVVAERGEVDDRMHAIEIFAPDVADVALDRRHLVPVARGALAKIARVEPHDVVAAVRKHRRQHRPDVTLVARHEHATAGAHAIPATVSWARSARTTVEK